MSGVLYTLSDFERETVDRNSVLVIEHICIPSYVLWREMDIENESIESRINWWTNYKESSFDSVKKTADYWLKKLKKD